MKLKKFFALALAAATLALALTACGSKADDSADNSDANTDNQTGKTVTVKLGVSAASMTTCGRARRPRSPTRASTSRSCSSRTT